MTDQTFRAARSDATLWRADARSRATNPPTADETARARLDALGQTCAGAQATGALLSITSWHPGRAGP